MGLKILGGLCVAIRMEEKMRKIILAISVFYICFLGLSGCTNQEKAAICIGKINITAKEFEDALSKSPYSGAPQDPETRRKFLDLLVTRKIILKEAERQGMDRDPEFLESVQFFWEQSLLRLVLNKKMGELSGGIRVSEEEVKNYYESRKSEFPGKDLSAAYEQIKLQLFMEKQRQALDEWTQSLRDKACVKIDYKLLGL